MLSERQRIWNLHSNKKGKYATETLVIIHMDVYEPMSWGRFPYFMIFIDKHSSGGWSIWWNTESEKVEMFKEFISEVEKQLGKSIKAPWLDQSEKYLNQGFHSYLRDNKILSQ